MGKKRRADTSNEQPGRTTGREIERGGLISRGIGAGLPKLTTSQQQQQTTTGDKGISKKLERNRVINKLRQKRN